MKNRKLESRLGYQFVNAELLTLALSHRSFGENNNERLEFLGDSLLNLTISDALFKRFPSAREGDLSRLRSALVKGDTLAIVAKEFGLGECLKLGEGELKTGGFRRSSILADAVEAIIGAIYLDSDMDTCRECVLRWFKARLDDVSLETTGKDPKTLLQEYLQERRRALPVYSVVESLGQAHEMSFVVECDIGGGYPKCSAKGTSKRAAEKLCAKAMLQMLSEKPIKKAAK